MQERKRRRHSQVSYKFNLNYSIEEIVTEVSFIYEDWKFQTKVEHRTKEWNVAKVVSELNKSFRTDRNSPFSYRKTHRHIHTCVHLYIIWCVLYDTHIMCTHHRDYFEYTMHVYVCVQYKIRLYNKLHFFWIVYSSNTFYWNRKWLRKLNMTSKKKLWKRSSARAHTYSAYTQHKT